ncbi:hypothetical protein, partial [Mesorhizobium sp. M7A.F.Ca.CA.002.09.1.1]|uniref:hypothetical protein n=1 Tax=Mesorhizobium sp. M7A.F.Ca.CA.002.09.1.1 TaxID=2496739 RepID=UPI0019CFEB0A
MRVGVGSRVGGLSLFLRGWTTLLASTGNASKELYNHKGTSLVSRLTYDDLDAHSSPQSDWHFRKGLLGAGGIR